MMREDDKLFEKFGEIYFSNIYKGVIKAWYWHRDMILNYSVVHGMIKMVLFDDCDDSSTKGNIRECPKTHYGLNKICLNHINIV